MLLLLTFGILLHFVGSEPLMAGQPGGPWTDEELDIVREKVIRMMDCQLEAIRWDGGNPEPFEHCWGREIEGLPDYLNEGELDEYSKDHDDPTIPRLTVNELKHKNIRYKWRGRGPSHSRLIQLTFHDCLKYEDGSGGCDGCLNWEGMGYISPRQMDVKKKNPLFQVYKGAWPKTKHTNNNKLQLTARSLELIYTVPTWPPGARALPTSLKESGKSRADLWAFAGSVGLERAVDITNENCKVDDPDNNAEYMRRGIDGNDKCEIKLTRSIPFRWGRVDCIPDEDQKWTPYPFEATKKELHSNAYGTGNQAVDDFKRDFNMTARETISLMATHGLTEFTKNFEESTKYKWIGGLAKKKNPISHHDINMMKGTMSNMYFKFLNGKTYWRGNAETFKSDGYFVGDANGDPVGGTAFYTSCTKAWNDPERAFGGPCHFRPTHPGCAIEDSSLKMRRKCFTKRADGSGFDKKGDSGCQNAELVEKDGFLYQKGGPPMSMKSTCQKGWMFAMPYEVSFVLNFTVIDNLPRGCGLLDGEWRLNKWRPYKETWLNKIYNGSPGEEGSTNCGPNTYAPEGEALADIVALFADDHDVWQETFFNAWEKMQTNGYDLDQLAEGPSNGQLQVPKM